MTMKPILVFLFSGVCLATAFPVDEKNPFGYPDAAADAALAHGEADPARLDELLAFPAALAIPRLDHYLGIRSHPEHTKKAQELIPQVPGWLEYYQWKLAEDYKKANPPGDLNEPPNSPSETKARVEAMSSRSKMADILGSLAMLDRPEAISLLASYLDDHGVSFSDDDMGYQSIRDVATYYLDSYFKRTTGKLINMIPDERRAWWAANKVQYPPLPEKPPKPWFPPPTTPAPRTPRPATPDPVPELVNKALQEAILRQKPLREEQARQAALARAATPAPPPLIPHIRTEDETRPWRWLIAGICTLLAGGAAYFVLRPRR